MKPNPAIPTLQGKEIYPIFQAHDARFDGQVFVGVTSTGIYCRPVCHVKTPKAENCVFFASAAAAEAAGFRPCLRCRPELAPGVGEETENLAHRAAALIAEDALSEGT